MNEQSLETAYLTLAQDYRKFYNLPLVANTPEEWKQVEVESRVRSADLWNSLHDKSIFYCLNEQYVLEIIGFLAGRVPSKIRKILNLAKGCKSILDFGSGTGSEAIALALEGYEVGAFDVHSKMYDFAQYRFQKHGVDISVTTDSLGQLSQQTFDYVVSYETLEHIENFEESLAAILRVAQKQITLTWSFEHVEAIPCHYDHSEEKALEMIAEAGFVLRKDLVATAPRMPSTWIRS